MCCEQAFAAAAAAAGVDLRTPEQCQRDAPRAFQRLVSAPSVGVGAIKGSLARGLTAPFSCHLLLTLADDVLLAVWRSKSGCIDTSRRSSSVSSPSSLFSNSGGLRCYWCDSYK